MATTVDDMMVSLRDFVGGDVRPEADRRVLTSINDAYYDMSTYHRWSYYYCQGRINTDLPYQTGTCSFDLGTSIITTTNPLPGWVSAGTLIIGNISYPIQGRLSSTTMLLRQPFAPQSSLAAGTVFQIAHDCYVLPDDYTQLDAPQFDVNGYPLSYVHPTQWLRERKIDNAGGIPELYTVIGDGGLIGRNPGKSILCLYPFPSDAVTIDFIYRRTPRLIRVPRYSEGTVTTALVNTTLVGTNTSWNQSMVGAIVRISADAISEPTSNNGENPYEFEFFVKSIESATSLTMSGVPTVARTNVKYVISDPIDVDENIMLRAMRRNVERQMSFAANMATRATVDATYKEALYQAIEADNRSFQQRTVGSASPFRRFVYTGDG